MDEDRGEFLFYCDECEADTLHFQCDRQRHSDQCLQCARCDAHNDPTTAMDEDRDVLIECLSPESATECALMRERLVAGVNMGIPDCPVHGEWSEAGPC